MEPAGEDVSVVVVEPDLIEPELPSRPAVYRVGPATGTSIKTLCNLQKGIEVDPTSTNPFCDWAARRITSDISAQDLVVSVSGKRGSGKSVSALYLCWKMSLALSQITGKPPETYFASNNICALEDTEEMLRLMGSDKTNQIYLLDDASVGLNSRNFSLVSSKNAIALFTTMRTRRCVVVMTMPLVKNTDLQIREFIDVNFTVYMSKHAGKFNVLKATSPDISTTGKTYHRRLIFNNEKIDYYIARLPPTQMLKEYEIVRSASANKMAKMIVETGTYHAKNPRQKTGSRSDLVTADIISNREKVFKMQDDGISLNAIGKQLQLSRYVVESIVRDRHGRE